MNLVKHVIERRKVQKIWLKKKYVEIYCNAGVFFRSCKNLAI